ncbi:putative nuclease HARBI1 [Ooceraea biroi]|uniref:putative nuclease HARBI1 n=1 Tax=Ooceraea biroi TaxID=2015173 RepID=UPI000F089995|nr:putative nuclease HARBI1 [Ooceraea biroi]
MDSNLVLAVLANKLQKWRKAKATLQHRKVEKRNIAKLIVLWKLLVERKRKEENQRTWVRPIFTELRRYLQGASDNLVVEMELQDKEMFYNYCRMSTELFEQLLSIVGPFLNKQIVVRDPIPARTRLLVCLRYLASGDSMTSIAYAFRIGTSTVSKIINETCDILWNSLRESVMPPINEESWLKIADEFERQWNFPHCIGAIDGKHVILQAPPHSGSVYYNYKGTHSISLLAVSDANYCFTLVDIGAERRQSDGGIFANSNFGQRFERNEMNVPQPNAIEPNGPSLPYVLLADEAFALKEYMMRPYPRSGRLNRQKKIFNYRLSRGRRVVESSFGILTSRWRIYRRPIISSISTATKIVQATTCLHNFVMKHENNFQRQYPRTATNDTDCIHGALREINDAGRCNAHSRLVSRIRDDFASYFEHGGAVPWQWQKVLNNDF